MVSIEVVESGLACNCKCPNCWADLIARKGEVNIHHFAHASWVECVWAYESAIHKLAKQILEEEKQIHLPDSWNWKLKKWQVLKFSRITLEKTEDRNRPDAIGVFLDKDNLEKTIWIEFANTHFVNEEKENRIKELGISCIEINIREQTEKGLKSFLIGKWHERKWINNTFERSEDIILQPFLGDWWILRKSEAQRNPNAQTEEQISKRLDSAKIDYERYLKKNKEFEEEGRKVIDRFSPKYSRPYNCPIRNEYFVWCKNCTYKISLFEDKWWYSSGMCGYWAKRKQP